MSLTGTVGRYRILGELGRGATGVVYRAQDPTIGRMVAIKTVPLTASSPEERELHLERLRREAQLAGRLSHPGVVTVYDLVENTDSAYVCMEYVEGESLQAAIEAKRRFSQADVLRILREAAEALDYAHLHGVVHRDIKPGNILIGSAGDVKIADFGVAKEVSDDATVTGAMHGTPAYMSPEQMHSRPAGGRSDQYSLGVVAYELLTGERPFVGDSVASIAYKVGNEPPLPPSLLNSTLGDAVNAVFARVLAKDPTMRFASARDFVNELGRALAVSPGWEPKVRGECAQPSSALSTFGRSLRRRRRRYTALYAALVTLGAVGFIAGMLWQAEHARRPTVGTATQTASIPVPPAPRKSEPAPPLPLPPQVSEAPLTAPPAPPAPLNRPSAESLQSLRYTYNVAIDSAPSGATVHLDNLPLALCETPCRVALTPGTHSLKFDREGYRPRISELEVPGLSHVFVVMEAKQGTLLVKSDPPGAKIFVDGKEWSSVTPATLNLPIGQRKIVVRRDGYPAESHDVLVRDGAVATLEVSWK
jgi:serine/threonine-protein kinase